MNLLDVFQYALRTLTQQKLRSWLTVLGIVIGITTIVSIVSIGDGIKKDITDQLDSFGNDNLIITPNSGGGSMLSRGGVVSAPTSGKLFERDLRRIESLPGILSSAKILYARTNIEFKENALSSVVYGVDDNMFNMWENYLEIEDGRYFREGEKNVVVLAADAANDLFGKQKIGVGNIMKIGEEDYRVVGVLKKIGFSLSGTDDSAICVPFENTKKLFGDNLAEGEVSFIYLKIDPAYDANEIKERVEVEIANSHKVTLDNLDFSVITSEYIKESVNGVLGSISIFLLLIAAIASLVSAIGITNTMFMTVVERTKEIGVLKSIGATSNNILSIFLVESGLMGTIGGIFGLILGTLISLLVNFLEIPAVVTLELAVGSLIFAFVIGAGAGLWPALRASKLSPLEALRYH